MSKPPFCLIPPNPSLPKSMNHNTKARTHYQNSTGPWTIHEPPIIHHMSKLSVLQLHRLDAAAQSEELETAAAMLVSARLGPDNTQGPPTLIPCLGAGVPQAIRPLLQPPDSHLPPARCRPGQLLYQIEVPADRAFSIQCFQCFQVSVLSASNWASGVCFTNTEACPTLSAHSTQVKQSDH
jgi:hypothetical protein